MEEQKAQRWLEKTRHFLRLDKVPPLLRRMIVAIVGGLFLLVGLVMIVTPGPALVFIPAGILLLATEFTWAKFLACKGQALIHKAAAKWRARKRQHAR
jgi:hypothetical protein